MRDDANPDARVGSLFRRLSMLRIEFGETAFDRTIQSLLQTLGAAALGEAERRARALAERSTPNTRDVRVTVYADRRSPDPIYGCDDER
ncbi:hypothetical protein [Methylorubrum populi]